jgi:hypothetical protein
MAALEDAKPEWPERPRDPSPRKDIVNASPYQGSVNASPYQAPSPGAGYPLSMGARRGEPQVPAFVKASTSNDPDRVYRERVLCRVYHLQQSRIAFGVNRMTQSGLYHTGVEVYGREWWFGATFDEWTTGITWNPPKMNRDHTYKETLLLGYTSLSPMQVWQAIEDMKWEWRGCSYHLLSRNCHHFTDAFCQKLGVNRPPYWINHLGNMGEGLTEILSTDDLRSDGTQREPGTVSSMFSSMTSGIYSIFGGSSEEPQKQIADADRPPQIADQPNQQMPDKRNGT